MRVMVTGGAGFIGSHIVDALVRDGHEVAVVDDLSSGKAINVNPQARMYAVSITDSTALEEVFKRVQPETVSHHAAHTSVRESMTDPEFDARVNILGSINVLHLCAAYGVERIIFASTSAVYAEPVYVPMDELHPVRPQSAYGMAKYSVENYIRMYSDTYGLRYKIFRYGNVYGPRQDPHGEAGVVAIFARQLLAGTQPTIFGDGTKTRDYVYVDDVVSANMLAMSAAGDNEIANLAPSVEISDLEIFEAVCRATDVDMKPIFAQKRPGEADRVSLDSAKVKKMLQWTPKVALDSGVLRLVTHLLRNVQAPGS